MSNIIYTQHFDDNIPQSHQTKSVGSWNNTKKKSDAIKVSEKKYTTVGKYRKN